MTIHRAKDGVPVKRSCKSTKAANKEEPSARGQKGGAGVFKHAKMAMLQAPVGKSQQQHAVAGRGDGVAPATKRLTL